MIKTLILGMSAVLLSGGAAFAGTNGHPIPEPGTLGILAAAAVGVAVYRHLRGRK